MPAPLAIAGTLAALAALGWIVSQPSPRAGKYFTLDELTRSQKARDLGLSNAPDAAARANLQRLTAEVLDPLREALGRPLHVSSGYRSPAVNRAVGGVPGSHHQMGRAADVKADGVPAAELMRLAVELDLPFDTALLYEAKSHLHIDQRQGTRSQQRRRLYYQPAEGQAEQLLAPPRRDRLT